MGHSFITGNHSDFEVRDSVCETILRLLLEKLHIAHNLEALKLVRRWHDDWELMPPGCKSLKVTTLPAPIKNC